MVYASLMKSPDGFMTADEIASKIWSEDRPKYWNATVNRLMLLLRAKTQSQNLRVVKRRLKRQQVIYFLENQGGGDDGRTS